MKREDIFSILSLIVVIIILITVAFFAGKKLFGKEGVIDQYQEADTEYNKSEIVEKLNLIVKEKYIFDYKYAQENQKNIDEIHTTETVIQYLLDEGYFEPLKDTDDNVIEDEYYINPNAFSSDIATSVINGNGSESNGTRLFKVKKIADKFAIYFINKYGEEEELGELVMNP